MRNPQVWHHSAFMFCPAALGQAVGKQTLDAVPSTALSTLSADAFAIILKGLRGDHVLCGAQLELAEGTHPFPRWLSWPSFFPQETCDMLNTSQPCGAEQEKAQETNWALMVSIPPSFLPTFTSVWIKRRISLEYIPGTFPGNWEQKPLNRILFWAMRFAVPRFSFKMLVVDGWLASPRRGEAWLLWEGFDDGVIWSRNKGPRCCNLCCSLTPVLWTLCLP